MDFRTPNADFAVQFLPRETGYKLSPAQLGQGCHKTEIVLCHIRWEAT